MQWGVEMENNIKYTMTFSLDTNIDWDVKWVLLP